jgi:DNA-binding LytR/AlgR family response regulator
VKTQSPRWLRKPSNTSSVRCHVVDLGTGGPAARRLVLHQGSSVRLLPVHQILWAEARGGRVSVHSSNGELTIGGILMNLTHALGEGFQQITRNTIVNMNAVSEIRRRSRKGESSVVLLDGRVLPVSRLFASSLRLWISPTGTNHRPAPEESVSPTRPAHSA